MKTRLQTRRVHLSSKWMIYCTILKICKGFFVLTSSIKVERYALVAQYLDGGSLFKVRSLKMCNKEWISVGTYYIPHVLYFEKEKLTRIRASTQYI